MLSDSVDERTCPACKQIFKKISGRNSHLKQARKCAWYNRQLFEFPEDSDCETDNIEQSGGTGDEIANDSVLDTDISLEEEVGPVKELQSIMKLIRKSLTKRDHKVGVDHYGRGSVLT